MANIVKIKNKNGISYKVQLRHIGYKPIYKTFKGVDALQKAKKWIKSIEGKIADGTYKDETSIEKNLNNKFKYVKDLIEYYKENIAPEKYSYAEKYNALYNWWIDKIGDLKLKELTSAHLSSCKQILANTKIIKSGEEVNYSNNTINKYLMAISAILTYGYRELEIIENNPMSKVKAMKKPNGRTRFLNKQEIKLLADICKQKGEDVYLFFVLSICTGGRYSEVLNLKIENIDQKNKRIHYLNTKNKTNRGIGIDETVLNLINNYCEKNEIKSGNIFWNKNNKKLIYMRGQLLKAISEAGLVDFHIHDLRHTFASISAENGANLLEIAILLGHKSLVMARRYSHLTQQHTDDIARNTSKNLGIL